MLPDGRRLGAHLPLGRGMVKAVDRAHEIGATALQVFADNPTAWRRRAGPPGEGAAFRDRLVALDIHPVAIHASYLVNLAGPEEDFFARSVEVLASDLRAAPGFSARFVNVHIGSHRGGGVAAGIERLADGLALVLAEVDGGAGGAEGTRGGRAGTDGHGAGGSAARIVLENSAGSGFGLGVDVAELAAIAEAAARRNLPADRIGFCLDVAHAWAAGIDVGDPSAVDALLADFDARIGLDRLVMVHLNDSKSELGSRIDRHEHLGAGQIGVAGLRHVLTHPALGHATFILETPGMDEGYDAINLGRAYDIAARRPLAELPPGALEIVSGRARLGPPGEEPRETLEPPEPVSEAGEALVDGPDGDGA